MTEPAEVRLVAGFLTGGFFVFLTGAAFWKLEYQRPLRESLAAIAESPARWRWINTWMSVGIVVTLLGLGGLTHLFLASGGSVFSSFGLLMFATGALVWLVGVAWRLTVLPWAASELQSSRPIPADLAAWSDLFGQAHSFHLILAYLSWIALGASVLDTGILPQWLGWLGLGLGGAGATGYVAFNGGPFAPPILAHLYTMILGIALIIHSV